MSDRGNLFAALPKPGTDEHFDVLLNHPAARIERILSFGHASPPGMWYDVPGDEWVMLAAGSAELVLALDDGIEEHVGLLAGSWIFLPAHCRHRVVSASADAIWLAINLPGR